MSKPDYIDFQTRTEPLAYLITFRCYGTWLHGDKRGSMDRRKHNLYAAPKISPNRWLVEAEETKLLHQPIRLSKTQRRTVERAIREACNYRRYELFAVNARSNHVHSVVGTISEPERAMNTFKSYATRKLREAGLLEKGIRPWSRHGSTPYLWTPEDVEAAINYVINGQDNEPFVRPTPTKRKAKKSSI